jgi:STE24 endopeptidase
MKNLLPLVFVMIFAVSIFGQTEIQQPTENKMVSQSVQTANPVVVPSPSEKAMSYYNSGIVLWIVGMILGLLIPFLFLQTRASAKIRDFSQKIGRKWFFAITIYFIIFLVLTYIIGLPLDFYQDYLREHDYGLSNQSFGRWFSNSLITLVVSIVVGSLFLWIPYLLLRKSPRRWWLYTGVLLIPFIFLAVLVTPVWINPLFNNFGEMKDKQLEAKILALADRAGIEGSRVYEVDKSADTNAVNAYVTGFMSTKRIVLWDTILKKLDERELLFVMGHEMGHYVLGHVWKGILFSIVLIFITLFLAYKTSDFLIKKYGARWGFSELSDPAAFPLILLIISVFSLLISPLTLAYSRYAEHEADRFAIEITRDNQAGATAFVKLQTENLSNPRPSEIIKILRASHPPIGERVDFCNSYKPWETGEPLKYGDLFKER